MLEMFALLSMDFYLSLVLFQEQKVSSLTLWFLQMMICFGNSSSWEAKSWQFPQYIENS